jgi:hypothetical protein
MFDPDAHMPRVNRGLVYLGACLIAGIRLARERQVNVKVVPTGTGSSGSSITLSCEVSSTHQTAVAQLSSAHVR